jgi:hypothetical protein
MDILTGSSQNFFVLIASFSFALFAAARAVESIRNFYESPEDFIHLNSMLLLSLVILIIAILPLVLCDISQCVQICSYLSFFLSAGLLAQLIWNLVKGTITFYYKNVAFGIIVLCTLITLAYLLNAIIFTSILVYRLLLLIAFLVLCYRYYLVLGHYVAHSRKSKTSNLSNNIY